MLIITAFMPVISFSFVCIRSWIKSFRTWDRAWRIKLGIGLRMNNSRRAVLARVSVLSFKYWSISCLILRRKDKYSTHSFRHYSKKEKKIQPQQIATPSKGKSQNSVMSFLDNFLLLPLFLLSFDGIESTILVVRRLENLAVINSVFHSLPRESEDCGTYTGKPQLYF